MSGESYGWISSRERELERLEREMAARAAREAAARARREARERKERQQLNKLSDTLENVRNEIEGGIVRQQRLSAETAARMTEAVNNQRNAMLRAAESQDETAFADYSAKLREARDETMRMIARAQRDFAATWQREITDSITSMRAEMDASFKSRMDELTAIKSDMAARDTLARDTARACIDEAESLIASLEEDFDGRCYSPRQLSLFRAQIAHTESQFGAGHFEAAIAGAKDVATAVAEEMFETEARRCERENWLDTALTLSSELKAFIETQSVITAEMKQAAEQSSGKSLEDDIVGVRIADYTGTTPDGRTRFDVIFDRVTSLYNELRAPAADDLDASRLREIAEQLNGELYAEVVDCVRCGVSMLNNAFSRQNVSEEIIDFFEEHNFTFTGYSYDDDRHDKTLHIGLRNDTSGEELIITLSPDASIPGDVKTGVSLKQIAGDGTNEERKEYYRKAVSEAVTGGNPYAKVEMKCRAETRGRLSIDDGVKQRLRAD